MKLRFSIHYSTAWGESLHVVIRYRRTDGKERVHNVPMQTSDGELWTVETAAIESRQASAGTRHQPIDTFCYHYQVEDTEGRVLRREWTKVERCYAFDASKDYIFPDAWRDYPLPDHLYSMAFHVSGFKSQVSGRGSQAPHSPGVGCEQMPLFRKTVVFRVSAPQLRAGESLGLCGGHPSLGDWSPSRFLPMLPIGDDEWQLSVNVEHAIFPMEYKYVVVDEHRQVARWEDGENRVVNIGEWRTERPSTPDSRPSTLTDGEVLVLHGGILHIKEDVWKAAGVVVPLFALRSDHSYGVGDIGDLRRLVDWASEVGLSMIQLLPVNDTTTVHGWTDSHPYNAVSAFALHPHYIDLEQLPALSSRQAQNAFSRQRRELNALTYSDYMAVDKVKSDYVARSFEQVGEETLRTADYQTFFAENEEWLVPYAAFSVLRDRFGTSRFMDWQQYAIYDRRRIARLEEESEEMAHAIHLIYYIQYHLHRQMKGVAQYAREHHVALVGDLPVGIYRDSVETWTHPELFRMDMQMGTMPTPSEPMGQNWGFPTYQWGEALEEWLRRRLRFMEQYFDAVRIDHILSLFRVWEIPCDAVSASLGHFSPSLSLTAEEIESYGLTFRHDFFTRPFVNDSVVERLFGIHADYVKEEFLQKKDYHLYDLKPTVDTQQKIAALFRGKNDENSRWISDGLMRLVANVLFVETSEGMYAPRHNAQQTPLFGVLSAKERDAFLRIYHNYYYERHNDYWNHLGDKHLESVLRDTRLLVCGDDLGEGAQQVQQVLGRHRILSLEVQTHPKRDQGEFGHLEANDYRSVATISTHDMPSLRLWWEEDPGRVQRYYATMLQKEGRAPRHLTPLLAEEIIARHIYCPSMLCMLSIQDWLAMSTMKLGDARQERINAPYDSYNQWKYRMPVTIEQLLDNTALCRKVKTMVERSGRGSRVEGREPRDKNYV